MLSTRSDRRVWAHRADNAAVRADSAVALPAIGLLRAMILREINLGLRPSFDEQPQARASMRQFLGRQRA